MSSAFFAKYRLPNYNPHAPMLDEFERLSDVRNWTVGGYTYRQRRRELLHGEFKAQYGIYAPGLESWQALCRDVGIDRIPQSIKKCKRVLSTTWVNLVDLLEARRTRTCPPQRFKSKRALKEYSKNSDRIFPKDVAKEGKILSALLVEMSGV